MVEVDGVWLGKFDTYAQAQMSVSSKSTNSRDLFAQAEWLDRQASLAHGSASDESPSLKPPRPTNLPFAAGLMNVKTIVDFGGGSGWVREVIRASARSLELYVVIDVDSVVERFSEVATPHLRFVSADSPVLDELAGETDILYSNSALQYLPDNSGFRDVVKRVRPDTVLVDELLWSATGRDWFSIQVNSVVPAVARFASIDRIVDDLASLGYRLTRKDPYSVTDDYAFPSMDTLPPEVRIPHALSLTFARGPSAGGD
jgi:putative methyltransferase (TIGR04325 family)